MTNRMSIYEYVQELIEEIGSTPISAGGHRAYQLAQYLPAIIEFVKMKDELADFPPFTMSLDRATHVELDLAGLAQSSASPKPKDVAAEFPIKVPTEVTTEVTIKEPTKRKRKPRTDEQRAKEAASMRRRRAERSAEREKAKG